MPRVLLQRPPNLHGRFCRCLSLLQAAGVPVAVCSAATKSAVEFVLGSLLGQERFGGLDLFMAGDDVKEKKPDPTIYKVE